MPTIKVILKQHTPLIHFQHDQDRATLRASEVKPKLDKYLKNLGYLVPNYKMKIIANEIAIPKDTTETFFKSDGSKGKRNNAPMFFGNQNAEFPKKLCSAKELTLLLSVKSSDLDIIKDIIVQFFLVNNFGTRQSKGYGSFTVKEIDGKTMDSNNNNYNSILPENYISYFTTSSNSLDNYQGVFCDIELLHKTLRSGINGPSAESLYCKSLLFAYAEKNGTIWDKKTVKSLFLGPDTKKEVERSRFEKLVAIRKDKRWDKVSLPSKSDPKGKDYNHWETPANTASGTVDIRDYLGFSSSEKWMAYDTGSFEIKNGSPQLIPMSIDKSFDTSFKETGRFKSPIIYKPIFQEDNNTWMVYILVDNSGVNAIAKQKVHYRTNMPKTTPFSLDMWDSFNVTNFLMETFSLGNEIKNYFSVDRKPVNPTELKGSNLKIYNSVNRIYSELQKNIKKISK